MTLRIDLPSAADAQKAMLLWQQAFPPFGRQVASGVLPAKALRHLGLTLWKEGHPAVASQVLATAAALAPEAAPIWSDLAGVFFALGKTHEALACIETSLDKDPSQPHGWLLLASLQMAAQDVGAAETAYVRALALDENLSDAAFGLGLLYFEQKRFEPAAERLKAAIARGPANPAAQACLGQALYFLGRFVEAAPALAVAVEAFPDQPKIRARYALLRFLQVSIEGPIEEAFAAYSAAAGPTGEDLRQVSRTAFHLLSGYGYREAAIALGRLRLDWEPGDPVQLYLQAAVEGETRDRAPDDYIKAYFNAFAEGFDKQLVEVLDYRVPEKLCAMLGAKAGGFGAMLDLGCGTGLAGPLLRPLGHHLTGVDLAPSMLQKAAERGLYDALIEAEAVSYLTGAATRYDLVFAADVLIYFGNLRGPFAAATQVLSSGGLFAFNIETTAAADYELLASGRFAHSRVYIEEIAARDFVFLGSVETIVRLEANRPVAGTLIVLQRR